MTDLTGPHPVHLFKFVSICLLLSAIMNLTKVSDFKSIAGRSQCQTQVLPKRLEAVNQLDDRYTHLQNQVNLHFLHD